MAGIQNALGNPAFERDEDVWLLSLLNHHHLLVLYYYLSFLSRRRALTLISSSIRAICELLEYLSDTSEHKNSDTFIQDSQV